MRVVFIYAILFILISVCQNSFTTENISSQYSPLTLDEHNEITNTITNIYNFIEKTKNNQEKIKFLKSLPDNNHKDSLLCKSCLWFYGHMHSFLMKKYGVKATFYLLTLVCSLGMSKNVCNEYLNLYGPVIYDSIVDHYINGEYVCSLTRVCKDEHFIKLNADDYAKDLLKDKPLNVTTPFIDIQAPTWKVLQVADLHVDYLYLEGSKAKCSDPLCCRISDKTISSTERAGKWGSIAKCDLPLKTLELFTDYVNEEIKPDFILWTGDNPPHDPWTGSQEAAFNATQTFVDLISKNNNYSLPVYPTPGNHEMYPNDEYNPYDDSDKFLFNRLANIFKPWLSDEAYETFSKYGYYSQLHPNSNLRIVSTNCLLCDSINFNLIKNPTDPKDELKWLENTLRQSEQAGEVVYLIRHIPIGDGFFLDECAKRHLAIIDRFSHIIRGQFYGHTHYDEVKISRNYFNKDIISGIMFIAPSLTTVFDVDSNSKIPKDYIQYRLNLTNANSLPENEIPQFDIAYKASEFFNIKYLNDTEGISKYTQDIITDQEVFDKALKAYYSDGDMYQNYKDIKNVPEYLSCKFSNAIFSDYLKCIKEKPLFLTDYSYKLLNILDGSWFKKLPESS